MTPEEASEPRSCKMLQARNSFEVLAQCRGMVSLTRCGACRFLHLQPW